MVAVRQRRRDGIVELMSTFAVGAVMVKVGQRQSDGKEAWRGGGKDNWLLLRTGNQVK